MTRFGLHPILATAAFTLALALATAPAQAHCTTDETHNTSHKKSPCKNGGGGDDGGGKDQTAASFDDSFSGIESDGGGLYVNGESGVDVKIGGAGRRIRIDLNSDGSQGNRFFTVNAECVDAACAAGDPISDDFPEPATDEYVTLDVFHVADMPADGKFYPKNALFQIGGLVDSGTLQFKFREPELFNPGGNCSAEEGSAGAGTSVWVARSQDGGTWTVTTEAPLPGDLGDGLIGDEAGEVACLEVQTSATGNAFGGNYSIPFAVQVGPESSLAP